jgi:hypothetical protein
MKPRFLSAKPTICVAGILSTSASSATVMNSVTCTVFRSRSAASRIASVSSRGSSERRVRRTGPRIAVIVREMLAVTASWSTVPRRPFLPRRSSRRGGPPAAGLSSRRAVGAPPGVADAIGRGGADGVPLATGLGRAAPGAIGRGRGPAGAWREEGLRRCVATERREQALRSAAVRRRRRRRRCRRAAGAAQRGWAGRRRLYRRRLLHRSTGCGSGAPIEIVVTVRLPSRRAPASRRCTIHRRRAPAPTNRRCLGCGWRAGSAAAAFLSSASCGWPSALRRWQHHGAGALARSLCPRGTASHAPSGRAHERPGRP